MHDIVITEDVWADELTERFRDRGVLRQPDAWSDRKQLCALAAGARALVVRNRTLVDRGLLAVAPRLEVIGRFGVGLDNIDMPAADAGGVVVVAAAGANAVSVAEHTLALALVLSRQLTGHDAAVRSSRWQRSTMRRT